ncbi:hypothetical protein GLAREA_06216 [Glarea lozoyensis ATCC 20868]|uniref:Uncharacterized protein n=1 Tax=Glarea lozoyensis (strain ATCC 20868 / MF5171) TaxID=1116229 RepID=S3D7V9_GLAL2|nr:uncharacterized protein GLAREA_06216 [Glarea lozoyensis ATCC 20868]EPE33204.1 hypothetical protein GLAREA_06216 [Glarea lozoyensis ATCC 20868]
MFEPMLDQRNIFSPLLEKFLAHVTAHQSPFESCAEGSEEFQSWLKLLKSHPQFAIDMAISAGKNWNGTKPWDEEHRSAYTEEELDLNEIFAQQILERREEEEIEAAAKQHCIRSLIELQHLNRKDEH